MKTPSDKVLPCAIFGHNYVRSKTNIDQTIELTCSHCDLIVVTDQFGNFENHTISNSQIKDTLQELYRLRRRITMLKVS